MRYAIITNGIVTNVAEINPYVAAKEFPDAIQSDIAGIGDEYREERFWREGRRLMTQAEMYADAMAALAALEIEQEEVEDDA